MIKFAFFGSSEMSIHTLDELERVGLLPTLVVTTADKPVGRKLVMTPNIVKTWALSRKIPVIDDLKDLVQKNVLEKADVFIVASYGKIIPEHILNMPPRKTLNIHPSLLPLYRGASPLQQAMLDDNRQSGVSIIRLDKEMDHGPIVAQEVVPLSAHFSEWPIYEEFEKMMATHGAKILAKILSDWVLGKVTENEQDHSKATYTKKISKEDALVDLNSHDQYSLFRKIQAYHASPTAYFFIEKEGKKMRVKITSVSFKDNKLVIERVIPEGKNEMKYSDFLLSTK